MLSHAYLPYPITSTSSVTISSTFPSFCAQAYQVDKSGLSMLFHFSLRYVFAIRSKNLRTIIWFVSTSKNGRHIPYCDVVFLRLVIRTCYAISDPERQASLTCGGVVLLEHLIGFGVQLCEKNITILCTTGQNTAQTSRINDKWSTFFSFANPGAALVPCEMPFRRSG